MYKSLDSLDRQAEKTIYIYICRAAVIVDENHDLSHLGISLLFQEAGDDLLWVLENRSSTSW